MQTTIRTSTEIAKLLAEVDDRPTTASQTAIELFVFIRRATLAELKGTFTGPEIKAMVDAYNGTMLVNKYLANTKMFAAHMEDAETLDGTCTRHQANAKQLLIKLEKLTSAQAATMQLELSLFWKAPDSNLDKFIEKLA